MPRLLLLLVLALGCAAAPEPVDGVDGSAWIAFASGRTGNGDIYAVNPQTGELRRVVGTPAAEGTVRFDAARARLVHHRFDDESGRAMLVAEGIDLFEDPNGDVAPVWSPDGSWIAYAAVREDGEHLYLARADGTAERRLTSGDVVDRYPAWSPDGDRLVFARRSSTGWDLHVIDPFAPSPAEPLTRDGIYVGHPAWSPDGRAIAFDTLVGDQSEIVVLTLESGQRRRLTNRAGNDLIPAWSPDGRAIAFGGEPDGAGNWDLWLVDLETLALRRLTTDAAYDGGPVYVAETALGPRTPGDF